MAIRRASVAVGGALVVVRRALVTRSILIGLASILVVAANVRVAAMSVIVAVRGVVGWTRRSLSVSMGSEVLAFLQLPHVPRQAGEALLGGPGAHSELCSDAVVVDLYKNKVSDNPD